MQNAPLTRAAVYGPCIGGGLQLASAADIRVVAPDAKMSIMEMRWGLIPDMGCYTTWRSLVRDDVLRELTYTNRIVTGEQGKDLGFVTHLSDKPYARAMEIATEIASKHPQAVYAAKRLIMESLEQDKLGNSPNQMEAVLIRKPDRAA